MDVGGVEVLGLEDRVSHHRVGAQYLREPEAADKPTADGGAPGGHRGEQPQAPEPDHRRGPCQDDPGCAFLGGPCPCPVEGERGEKRGGRAERGDDPDPGGQD